MQIPLQITFQGLPHSDAIEQHVRLRAKKLERFSDRIIRCNVTVVAPHHHHHNGNLYDVQIDLTVPGAEIAAHSGTDKTQANQDAYVAISSAFERAARQLEDRLRVQRGDVKHHEGLERKAIRKKSSKRRNTTAER